MPNTKLQRFIFSSVLLVIPWLDLTFGSTIQIRGIFKKSHVRGGSVLLTLVIERPRMRMSQSVLSQ